MGQPIKVNRIITLPLWQKDGILLLTSEGTYIIAEQFLLKIAQM